MCGAEEIARADRSYQVFHDALSHSFSTAFDEAPADGPHAPIRKAEQHAGSARVPSPASAHSHAGRRPPERLAHDVPATSDPGWKRSVNVW